MATGLLLDKRLSVRTLRDSRIVVDEAACTGATFTTLLNPDGDGKNYRLGTWTVSGYLAVLAAGEVERLLVGPGQVRGSGGYFGGQGGGVCEGREFVPAGMLAVTVGTNAGSPSWDATASQFNGSVARPGNSYGDDGAGSLYNAADDGSPAGWVSAITGTPVEYAQGGSRAASTPGSGTNSSSAQNGIVYIRWEI